MKTTSFYTLIVIMFSVVLKCYSQEYSQTEIHLYAEQILNRTLTQDTSMAGISPLYKEVDSIQAIGRDSTTYFYVANTRGNMGWVVLSNEKRYPATIIGFSDYGSFRYNSDIPPALRLLLEQHMNAIDSTRFHNPMVINTPMIAYKTDSLTTHEPIPLLDTQWDQSDNQNCFDTSCHNCEKVYNKFCPTRWWGQTKTCGKYYAGCGAVAMAQIMKYWNWPDRANIQGTMQSYDWDNMPNYITDETEMYKVDAIAKLLRHCGINTNTAYTASGSSATVYQIKSALQNAFGYHTADNVFIAYTWRELSSELMGEIDAKRPVICQASEYKDGQVAAHTFVIDGYQYKTRSDGTNEVTLHINFGWGASSDGYYNLDFNGYNKDRSFITQIYPNCSSAADNVNITTSTTISEAQTLNQYAKDNINVNSAFVVEDGGHVILEAGNQIRLLPGTLAQLGSSVRLSIRTSCLELHTQQRVRYHATETGNEQEHNEDFGLQADSPFTLDHTYATVEYTMVYNASGQLLQTIYGADTDLSALPSGFYVLQKHMTDGSVVSETIVKN